MFKRAFSLFLALGFMTVVPRLYGQTAASGDKEVEALLEPIRAKYGIPALAGAIVTGQGLETIGAVGVRKAGENIPVTIEDKWHLGSDTKAMTAFMIGALVERGKLRWELTMEEAFPEFAASLPAPLRKANLLHLLSHRAGLPSDIPWGLIPRTGTTREQRLAVFKAVASLRISTEPGAKFVYSNLGYVIAGAIAEKAADVSWEELMRTIVFEPLGMKSAGFGGTGTPGQVDQPWGHTHDGKPVKGNGPDMDNPPVMGPAGRVHCTLQDWAKFVADELRGARGEKALLKPETYRMLHTPPFGGEYALGWVATERPWGGGKILAHSGSNTMNYAVVFVAPLRDFAVLVAANRGGPVVAKACDGAASELVQRHLKAKGLSGS